MTPAQQRPRDNVIRLVRKPDLYEQLGDCASRTAATREPSLRSRPFGRVSAIADDFRSFTAEIRGSPYSHALVALAGFLAGLLLIIVPALIGAGMLS